MLCGMLAEEELAHVDLTVNGDLPLPCEEPRASEERYISSPAPSIFGEVLGPRCRPGFDLAPVMLTWDVNVFLIVDKERARRAFACVPRDCLSQFLMLLPRGELDRGITAYLTRPPRGRKLHKPAQTHKPGLYDELGPRINLLQPERLPMRPNRCWLRQPFQPAA
jgi:hypothetical protein